MKILPQIHLVSTALTQWRRVLFDAIGDYIGSSFSFDPKIVTNPNFLNEIINQDGVGQPSGPAQITKSEILDITSISSNCNNLVIKIEHDANYREMPDSLFVKLPSPSLATRWFFNIIGSWELECYFFRHVADSVPIRTPIVYAVANRSTRFALVQENLHADPSVKLFTNLDMLKGPPISLVKRCLDTFARLHSAHHELTADEREALLPLDQHPFLGPTMRTLSQSLNQMGLKPCLKKHPDVVPEHIIKSYQKTLNNWDALLDYWFAEPLSLIHGDSHLGNFFEYGDEMGMLDWQAVHWGNGLRDVQYFLIDSLPVDILAEHEQSLIDYYVERRSHYGSPIDRTKAWEQYRSFTYHTLMTIIVSIGFGAMNEEQDQLMREILIRSVAAVERANYPQWLDEYLKSVR